MCIYNNEVGDSLWHSSCSTHASQNHRLPLLSTAVSSQNIWCCHKIVVTSIKIIIVAANSNMYILMWDVGLKEGRCLHLVPTLKQL